MSNTESKFSKLVYYVDYDVLKVMSCTLENFVLKFGPKDCGRLLNRVKEIPEVYREESRNRLLENYLSDIKDQEYHWDEEFAYDELEEHLEDMKEQDMIVFLEMPSSLFDSISMGLPYEHAKRIGFIDIQEETESGLEGVPERYINKAKDIMNQVQNNPEEYISKLLNNAADVSYAGFSGLSVYLYECDECVILDSASNRQVWNSGMDSQPSTQIKVTMAEKVELLTGDDVRQFVVNNPELRPRILVLWHRVEWTGPNLERYVILKKGEHVNKILPKIPEEYELKNEGKIRLDNIPLDWCGDFRAGDRKIDIVCDRGICIPLGVVNIY